MNELYSIYLSVLRSFVDGSTPLAATEENWSALAELSYINNTRGILSYVYKAHPDQAPAEVRPQLRRHCLQEISLYARRAEQTKLLSGELSRNGIRHILFKGFVLRQYYPVPELRTYGDVDIIIGREDRQKSDQLMLELGFTRKDDWEPSFSYLRDTEYYEFHSRIIGLDVTDKADFVTYFADILPHTRPATVVEQPLALEFTPEFHFIYLLTHIAKHINGSGAGVRMYLDIAFFLRHFENTLNWSWILQELEKLQLRDFANVVLTAVERWFGVAAPVELRPVPEAVMADFLDFTLSGGVYGYAGRDKGTVFLKQHNRNEAEVSRTKTLLYHAFPPAKALEGRFAYLQKHPWLLPAAWIHRLAVQRKHWGRFADQTKQILGADEEEVLKLKRIYKELGL